MTWLYRVNDDLSGLTFLEWDPSGGTDDASVPVVMRRPWCVVGSIITIDPATHHGLPPHGSEDSTTPVRLYSPCKTTMTSGHDVSECLDTLGLVKSYFFTSFFKTEINKIERRKCLGASTPPEDQAICLFAEFLPNPDMSFSLWMVFSLGFLCTGGSFSLGDTCFQTVPFFMLYVIY